MTMGQDRGCAVDYANLYDEYWARPDRWQSHSFKDAGAMVEQILALGAGRMLDVGCGMGLIVHTLRERGIDAHGVDVSALVIEEGNRRAPGNFKLGSILELPFPDDSFDTVVCTDVLEHLAEEDVAVALAELYRVTKSSLFATIATRIDRDGRWHLTVQDRPWWENRLFAAGFRKHPLTQQVVGYGAIESERTQFTAAFQKMPATTVSKYPLASLRAERGLHMDMLRESGRRSDAHIARYELARRLVRPGCVVLDAACGLGYGAAVMCEETSAKRYIGIDNSQSAIDYAQTNFGAPLPTEFLLKDATDLGFLDDDSVDLFVSMETLEHLPHPDLFLKQIRRVLRKGGRVVLSVPNDWTDETGKDPNPHHLHVYDWQKLKKQVQVEFFVEAAYAQTAGGGMKLNSHPRRVLALDPQLDEQTAEAEWWLAIGVNR